MKNVNIIACGTVALSVMASASSMANSESSSVKSPFFGVIEARTISAENKDVTTEVVRASLGAKGLYKYETFKAYYEVDVDFAPAANSQLNTSVGPGGTSPFDSDDDFWVRTAVIVLPSKYGKLVLGRGPSGNYLDVYKVMDIFKTNGFEPSSQNPNMLFDQGGYGFNVLSYTTPKFFNGAVRATVTNLSLNEANGEDSDALGYRVIYDKENLYFAISRVDIDRLVPTDYHRNTVSVRYKMDKFYVAGLVEVVENHARFGDQQNWGIVASYEENDFKYSIGYTEKDADVDAADDNLIIAGVRYQGFKNLEFWAEVAATDVAETDNLSAGVTLTF